MTIGEYKQAVIDAGGLVTLGKGRALGNDLFEVEFIVFEAAENNARAKVLSTIVSRGGYADTDHGEFINSVPPILANMPESIGTDEEILAATGVKKWIHYTIFREKGRAIVSGRTPDANDRNAAVARQFTVIGSPGALESYEDKIG